MIYKKLGIIVVALIVTSCGYFIAPRYIKKGFNIKFENKYTGIDNLINTNGYYEIKTPYRREIYSSLLSMKIERYEYDTTYTRFVFYPNGIYLRDFNDYISFSKKEDVSRYFSDIANNTTGKANNRFYNSNWGSYRISNDTIKVQYVNKPFFGEMTTFWVAFEIWYKIIDRNTIKEINLFPIHRMSNSDWENWNKTISKRMLNTAKFVPVDTIPKPNGWIINRRWFWKNNKIRK